MLSEAIKDVFGNARLEGIRQSFSDGRDLYPPLAAPCILWVPTQDSYGPPDSVGYVPDIFDGERVFETSMALRKAGCEAHIFTPYTPEGYGQAELILNSLLYACRDEWGVNLNWAMGTARWVPLRDNVRRNVWELIQPLQVFVPIWDSAPAQLLGAVQVTPKPLEV